MHLQILLTAVGDGKTQLNGNRLLRQRFSKIIAKHIQNGYTGEPNSICPVPEWEPPSKTKKAIYWELPFEYIQKHISKHGPLLDPKTRVHEPSQTVA